jgi:hypothetical protein
MSCSDRQALATWNGRVVQAANSAPRAMSGNLHLVIRSASQMKQASDSAPGSAKRQEIEQAQVLWAWHDRMRGSRARASLFYRDRTGLEHHGDGGRILMRACSAGGGAATAVSASTVEADRDGFSFPQARRKVWDRSRSPRHVSNGSLLVCELGNRSTNEASRHEAMSSVPPIVSSSRCVDRLKNLRQGERSTFYDACRMLPLGSLTRQRLHLSTRKICFRLGHLILQPKSHRFVLTATAQAVSESG